MVEEPPAGRPAAASVSSMVRLQPHRPSGRGRGSHRPQQETAAPSPSCSARRGFTSLRQLAREPSPACMKASIRTLRRMIRASWLSRCPLRFPPATCTSDRGSRHAPAAHHLLRHDASAATHRYYTQHHAPPRAGAQEKHAEAPQRLPPLHQGGQDHDEDLP